MALNEDKFSDGKRGLQKYSKRSYFWHVFISVKNIEEISLKLPKQKTTQLWLLIKAFLIPSYRHFDWMTLSHQKSNYWFQSNVDDQELGSFSKNQSLSPLQYIQ